MLSLLSLLLLAGCGNKEEKNNPNYNSDNYLSGTYYAMMEVADYGVIYLELDADVAPATVTNFVNLVNEGFYNGLTFHRACYGFVLQGGDPDGNGTGGSTYTVPGEFAVNGVNNTISHVRGTISMARANDYNSASSQFFIVQEDSTDLDGYYAAFGKVVSGMDIVDSICINTIVEDADGTVLAENQPVINFIRIINEDEVVYEESAEIVIDEPSLPAPEAVLTFVKTDSVDDILLADTLEVDADGALYVLSSSVDLLSVALYKIDLTQGFDYGDDSLLARTSDMGANTVLAIKLNVPDEMFPSILLVAEEHNGALSKYLLNYDAIEGAYLVPVSD